MSQTKPHQKSTWHRWVIGIITSVVTVGLLLLVTLLFGTVRGKEFSSETFQVRVYKYRRIPLLHWQISSLKRLPAWAAFEEIITEEHRSLAPSLDTNRWDLVEQEAGTGQFQGDAHILFDYLQIDRGGSQNWKTWNDSHPEIADLLWPEVVKLSRANLYIFLPDLLERAEQAEDVEQFQVEMTTLLADQFARLGKTYAEQEKFELAVRFFDESLSYDPNHAEAIQGRAGCGASADAGLLHQEE